MTEQNRNYLKETLTFWNEITEEEQEMLNRSCEIIKQHIETASQD